MRRLTTRVVTRWTVPDAALVRLMAHIKTEADLELVGMLSPEDESWLQLELSTDADWNGDFVQHGRERGGLAQLWLRHVGLPVQDLVQGLVGERSPPMGLEDDLQAISALERGCSEMLRCLRRTYCR